MRVTEHQISSGAVQSPEIQDGSVTNAKLAAQAVTGAKVSTVSRITIPGGAPGVFAAVGMTSTSRILSCISFTSDAGTPAKVAYPPLNVQISAQGTDTITTVTDTSGGTIFLSFIP